ncbi:Flavonol reductase/cinnamoyl-CoA reductase family protein [Schizosaccharomyces pombe]|uniref:Putative uncharacterized oxidoreductase C1773.04 n=1 Tax=Schizosaccharomyces pombe (strain 972 / ATCC 24843) TaxID=284812 RepID=YGD4_SCHPO|nr:methylglyoxyl reductase (NADPH-dependent) [Schizosaccharomyces pombe]O94563.1 RecName: Full=Putative uncharacterized oxidoreductase C1773.04; Flags: Precursor [Schizosaccharomyces pombe 972h-]CAA21909.1 mythylglyoxyl reductase (NADPH-dependent) (predicted) [Schizosaccharomyces pombe]|eukprot:NP_595119.1 methylglyoxyl reductase (NADPH-dependent) [Schizosaccharomyces pombe]
MSELVLITGITGFVASHSAEALLSQGYRVRGTYRFQEKLDGLLKNRPEWEKKVEFVQVPDCRAPNAYVEAAKGVDYVIHAATEVHSNLEPPRKDPHELLHIAIQGCENALIAAAQEPKVKRFVYISSEAALKGPVNYFGDGHVFTEKDWNPKTLREAEESDDELLNYTVCKKLGERAMHAFVARNTPRFQAIALNPPLILGPVFHLQSVDNLNFSTWFFWQLIKGRYEVAPESKFFNYVDVRDLAEAQVKALTAKTDKDRFVISGGAFKNDDIVNVALKYFPQFKDKIAKPNGETSPCNYEVDASLSIKELGLTYRPAEETFKDATESLYKLAGLL